ncbi:MAG: cysteine--tRNA ligase [Candidatus Omnitrophica bacterium]|nr:cysteine--tRNA ligase [Candidatus Omnitrophota bacterium]
MSIHIFNSLTRQKEEFIPLHDKVVKMYTCGVTVYDQCHIGHARSLYVFDVIRRYLRFRGYQVMFVRNITDVDDKIIQKANESKKTSQQVSEEQIVKYYEDLKLLGVNPGDAEPKATENIPEMIAHIQGLIAKDMAYAVDGDVYFNVRKFDSYGKLSGQSIDRMLEAVRIEKGDKKKDPLDFALWKKSKEGEPVWDSPWGAGRPGWHIECSCMSMKHLKTQTLDIHAGGRDLIFPHHENELAQSEGLTGKTFAKYWIHHGLLTINGQKMSKSLGNYITIKNAVDKYGVDTLKLFFLFSHYASAIDFNEEKVQDAKKALDKFDILFWKAYSIIKDKSLYQTTKNVDFVEKARTDFVAAMDDDFNTPKGLAVLFDLISTTHKYIDAGKRHDDYEGVIFTAVDALEHIASDIFGLFAKEKEVALSPELEALLDDRKQARADKDFKRSDELREALKQKGIAVEDTKNGQTWRFI